jgi:cytochrome c oxidase subunit 3
VTSDSQLDAANRAVPVHPQNGNGSLRRYRLGLALFASAIVMLFVAFSSAYIVRRGIPNYELSTGAYSTFWEPLQLPTGSMILGSALLFAASAAMELARRAAERRVSSFAVALTTLLALSFLGVQGMAWYRLRSKGLFMNSGDHVAFFYVFIGIHAVITAVVVAGLLLTLMLRSDGSNHRRDIYIDLSGWSVHFVTALWIYLALFLSFA